MGPPHTVPCFPIVIGYPPVVVGSTYIPHMQSCPHIYNKPSRPTMPQFLDSPTAVPLAQVEPEESMSAYLREYRALGDDFHSSMTFTNV